MRICFATDGVFPHVVGGMQRHSAFLVKHLAALGAQVDVIHPTPNVNCFPDIKGVQEFVIPNVRFPHYLTSCYLYSRRIAQFLKGRHYDVGISQGLPLWAYLPQRTFPCAFHPHGLEPFQVSITSQKVNAALFRWAERQIARHSDLVISLGGRLTDIVQKGLRVSEDRIAELPNGIDPSYIDNLLPAEKLQRRTNQFLFVGRLEPNKGITVLLEAFNALNVPDARLNIVGSGPLKAKLEKLADPNRVKFLGKLSDRELFASYSQADCFCFPSLYEGMPTVVMEAMATGLPVIATDIGAVPVLVREGMGEIVPPGDTVALHDALAHFCQLSPQEKASLGSAARDFIRQNFAWDMVAYRTLTTLETLINQTPN